MANDDNEKWSLPDNLDYHKNPAVREQAAQMRKDLSKRAVSPFARLSPVEFAKIRARSRIQHLSQSLAQVDQEIQNNRGRDAGHKLAEARTALAARLAEQFAIVGNYAMAEALHPDPAQRAEYVKLFRKPFNEFL